VILKGESVPRSHRWRVVRWGQRQLVRRAAGFLAIGTRNRRFYAELGVPEWRLVDAPYCVDNDRFATAAGRLRARRAEIRCGFGIPADALCLLFPGKSKRRSDPSIS
jgi:hypothetical protein